jgi:hypothetical protein
MISLNDTAEEITKPQASPQVEAEKWENDEEYVRLKSRLPKGVNIADAMEYGFFEHKHRYWVRRKEDMFEPISNFTMNVRYLIMGANPKRIVEITNTRGTKKTLDFAIEDLISLEKFKGRIESQGNFLFEGRPADLGKVKNKLFNEEKPSHEISRLGQHKSEFFAFANGIYDGTAFLGIDDQGMVKIGEENYYIPVFGATKNEDDEDLRNYRRFLHRPSATTFGDWARQMVTVYGDNGKVGIAFGLYALYSDIVFDKTKGAPMLFLFGQRGSGKGTMANSILALFGTPQDPIMLGGASTVVGFMRKLGQFKNALVWLDEYKNDIGEKKIESLKNIWDRVGYERGVKDSSNRTQTTSVTSSAMVSGQEIPNVEPALFSRCCLVEFRAMERSQEEVAAFNLLRRMEDASITTATLEALSHRKIMEALFEKTYAEIASIFRATFSGEEVIERQINNYACLVAVVAVLEKYLPIPFTSTNLIQVCEKLIMRQRDMMRQANEVQQFFEMVIFLLNAKLIDEGKEIQWSNGMVKIRMGAVFPLYREYSKRQGMKCMDRGTLQNYMTNSEAYAEHESKKGSHRFAALQNPTSATCFLQAKVVALYGVDFGEIMQQTEIQEDTTKTTPF